MADTWYSYDPVYGFVTHDTAGEARKQAEEALDRLRDESGDGWHEDVLSVAWGRFDEHASACETSCIETPEGDFDYLCDYELRPTYGSPDIAAERKRQTEKFGDQRLELYPGLALAILMEEVGEVAEALLKRQGAAALRKELVQVAAVCAQWIENIDRTVVVEVERAIEKLVAGTDGDEEVERG